eukprot:2389462-Pyramimonas_sp.AAC.1
MLGEVVLGLGETLVSGAPGRALTFTCAKDGSNLKVPPRSLGNTHRTGATWNHVSYRSKLALPAS